MAKYIDKADIIKLISECMFDLSDSDDLTRMLTEVDELPSVEIIHCKECKYAYLTYDGDCKYCDIWSPDEVLSLNGKYDYCSCAERRKD